MPFYQADQEDVARIHYSIWTAAEYGDLLCVRSHVDRRGIHPGVLDEYGYSALHLAAQHDHVEIARFLLERGAAADGTYRAAAAACTPLHRAAYAGAAAACAVLLDAGATLDAVDASFGDLRTPLHKAADAGHGAIVALLLDRGAGLEARDAQGQTALQVAAGRGRTDLVDLLVGRGADAWARTAAEGATAAHLAAMGGHAATCNWLLSRVAALSAAPDAQGRTPLDLLAKSRAQPDDAEVPLPRGPRQRPTHDAGPQLGFVDPGQGSFSIFPRTFFILREKNPEGTRRFAVEGAAAERFVPPAQLA